MQIQHRNVLRIECERDAISINQSDKKIATESEL